MKERPIIYSTEMVRAILDGRKSQTRRAIKPQPFEGNLGLEWEYRRRTFLTEAVCTSRSQLLNVMVDECPYGVPSDRLWVREAWRIESFMDGEPLLFGYKDGQAMEETEYSDTPDYENWYERVCIQSTTDAEKAFEQGLVRQSEGGYYQWDIGKSPCRWRSSRFMPRWASRLTLEITEVRVERLQEITEKGAIAEGIENWDRQADRIRRWRQGENILAELTERDITPIGMFKRLWDSLNAKRGYSWESNCWVWVISFKR